MPSSTESLPAQRVPTSKKMGSKLNKSGHGADASVPATGDRGGNSASPVVGQPGRTAGHKRRGEVPPTTDQSPHKKSKKDSTSSRSASSSTPSKSNLAESASSKNAPSSSTKPKKSVSFGDTPSKDTDTGSSPTSTKQTPSKKQQKKQKQLQQAQAADVTPALEYLRQWKASRDSWKFSKNLQSTLIKHIFEADVIPAADSDIFYEYIRDLRGLVRDRLRQTAMEIRAQDVSAGTSGFPDDTMDVDSCQETYDSILADVLRRKQEQRLKLQQRQQSPPQTSPKRKYFCETQYLSDNQDPDAVLRRLVKRMRAELVIDELSDGGDTTESSSSSGKTMNGSTATTATTATNGDNTKQLPSGAVVPPAVAGKRRRKLRVNMDDSSSESDSDSDSDTSSSGTSSSGSSSSDSDSDDEEEAVQRPDDYETSSSSSSSSSSGESSDEDMDSEDEDDE